MKQWISLPRLEGRTTRQAHADLPAGTYEREMGKEGFFGPASQLYHAHPPTGWSEIEGPMRPHAFDTAKLVTRTASPWDAALLLHNAKCRYRIWKPSMAMDHLARNADGDELIFVHQGNGALFCDFGHLDWEAGDYIMLPRGTQWRIEPASDTTMLLIEATNSSYTLPDKGMLGPHAIFDPGVLDTPRLDDAFDKQKSERVTRVQVKARQQLSTMTYPYNPLDAVGWKGDLVPVRLNVRDIRPVVSARYHLPPSVHTTFLADRFVVCTFAPRPIESDPGALNLPFFHSNDDYDEVLFYHSGDFISRVGINAGMMTLHPCGFPHGPQPGAYAAAMTRKKTFADEYAVMLDARDALEIGPGALACENPDYVKSWRAPPAKQAAE